MKFYCFVLKVIVVTCVYGFTRAESLNILGIFPFPVKSHFFVFEPYLTELTKRGHNLTVISYYPRKEPLTNYTDINLGNDSPQLQASHPFSDSLIVTFLSFTLIHALAGPIMCRLMMENEDIQNFLATDTKFNLVIVEQFNSDCSLAIAHKIGAPVIGITSHMVLPWHYQRYGIPYNPSTVLYDYLKAGTKTTLMQRVQRTLMYNYINFVQYYITQRLEQNVISEYIDDIPPIDELGKNVKLLLAYQNFVLSGSSILPANVIEVGGFHVSKPNPLPDDLRKFIEGSNHGVIYISFGSILKPTSMPKDKLLAIIEALETLEQRVIWKWGKKDLPGNPKNILVTKWLPQNDLLGSNHGVIYISFGSILKPTSMPKDKLLAIIEALETLEQRVIWKWGKKDLPGNPKNILVTKWLPQNDLLAHPKVLAFISHCGNLGVTEAIYHGVPIVGIPIFGDQPSNAAAIEESGLGVQITLNDLTKDRLLEKIKIVLNPSFRSNVKMLSNAWHDRPIKPMDTAIFWTEFAARHNVTFGAPTVPTYQYFGLDVIAVLILTIVLTVMILRYIIIVIIKKN